MKRQSFGAVFFVVKFGKKYYISKKIKGVGEMVVMYENLSKALDAFNANRVEGEQMEWHEVMADIQNPLDDREIMRLIIDLYEEA